jgi:hypothetical protein
LAKSKNFAASFRFRSILLNGSIISTPHTAPPKCARIGGKRGQLNGPHPHTSRKLTLTQKAVSGLGIAAVSVDLMRLLFAGHYGVRSG